MLIGYMQGALPGKHPGQDVHADDVADSILAALAP